jgi:hypothetical protein
LCPAVKPRLSRLRRRARKRKLRGRLQTGSLGPAAKDRARVVPPPPPSRPESPPEAGNTPREIDAGRIPGFGRTTWAVLLKRVFLVPPVRISATFGRPIHPGRLRCSSVTYVKYAPSSRLAVRAARPPKHDRSSDRRH